MAFFLLIGYRLHLQSLYSCFTGFPVTFIVYSFWDDPAHSECPGNPFYEKYWTGVWIHVLVYGTGNIQSTLFWGATKLPKERNPFCCQPDGIQIIHLHISIKQSSFLVFFCSSYASSQLSCRFNLTPKTVNWPSIHVVSVGYFDPMMSY